MNRHISAVGYDTVKIRVNFIIPENASTSWIGLSRPEFTLVHVFRRMGLATKRLLNVGLSTPWIRTTGMPSERNPEFVLEDIIRMIVRSDLCTEKHCRHRK